MEKITYRELVEKAMKINKEGLPHRNTVIVFTEDSFTEIYPLESRSYEVSTDNKAWKPNAIGYSIFGTSLDKTDSNVRLEQYMLLEHDGKKGWKVDYCYFLN